MNILILGAYGMLGHKLFQCLGKDHNVWGTCQRVENKFEPVVPGNRLHAGVVAQDLASVKGVIKKQKPEVILNCIGIIKQRDEASDPILSIEVNALFPHQLADICSTQKIRLIHFSTDCVFSGERGDYVEEDLPDARDLYGKTKHLGEVVKKGCVTLRSSIIGRELAKKTGLLEWLISQEGTEIKGYEKAIFSGFTTIAMADIVSRIITRHKALYGLWHVASEPISKYHLLELINKKMGLGITVKKDDDLKCDRSLNGSHFNKNTGFYPRPWESMIEDIVNDTTPYHLISS